MIDLKKEAARLALTATSYSHHSVMARDIIDLCTRYADERVEEAIQGLHNRQLRCLRSCVPNNAPLNAVLTYLDDAKRDTLAAIRASKQGRE